MYTSHYSAHRCATCWGSTETSILYRGTYKLIDRGEPLSDESFCSLICAEVFLRDYSRFRERRLVAQAATTAPSNGQGGKRLYLVTTEVESVHQREASEMFSGAPP